MGPYFCILLYLTILVLYSPRGKGPCLINLLHSPDHMLHLQWIFNRPLWLNDPMLHFLLYMWCNVTWVQWYNQQVRLTLQGVKLELTIFASAGRAFVVVLSLSRVHLSATPWTAAHQASLSFTIFWNLLRFMFTESVMPSNHLVLCHPFLLPSVFPTSGSFPMSQLFQSGGQSIRASVSVLPMSIQGWFPFGLTGFISLFSKGLSRVFSSTTIQK